MKKMIVTVILLVTTLATMAMAQTPLQIPLGAWVKVGWSQNPPDTAIVKYNLYLINQNTDDLVRKEITQWNVDSTSVSPPLQLEIGVGSWGLYLTAVNRYAESDPSNVVFLDIIPGKPMSPLNVVIQLVAAPVQAVYSTTSVNKATISVQRMPAQVQGVKSTPTK